jgi:Cys-tRNA(Pro)/Cys-tRNA(Cys) deacylase
MSGRMTPAVRALERAGVAFELLEYEYDPAADEIGMQAAQALSRPASTVFKTLVVALDSGELVSAIIAADARRNLKAIATAAGARKADLADPRKAERSTGYVVGGISPFGQRRHLRTFVDASALVLEQIVVTGTVRRGLRQDAAFPNARSSDALHISRREARHGFHNAGHILGLLTHRRHYVKRPLGSFVAEQA